MNKFVNDSQTVMVESQRSVLGICGFRKKKEDEEFSLEVLKCELSDNKTVKIKLSTELLKQALRAIDGDKIEMFIKKDFPVWVKDDKDTNIFIAPIVGDN